MMKFVVKIGAIFMVSVLCACGGGSNDKEVETPDNRAPIALINFDVSSIVLNNSVTISGALSSDPDGDTLSYLWAIKTADGEEYLLADNTLESFVFTPDLFGTYEISLIVRDSNLNSKLVTSSINVAANEKSYPIAITSKDMISKVGKVNKFSAASSIASEGQMLTYLWEIKSKPAASSSVIGDAAKIESYLIADIAGTYEISLTVTNVENQLTATSILTIIADELLINSAPVAIISTPLPSYAPNQLVRLNASDSYDSDGTDLQYQWRLAVPATESYVPLLVGDTTEFVEFTAVGTGDYLITLEVTDGLHIDETKQTITITNQNIAPVANAGSDQVVALGIDLILNAAGSSDIDGEITDLQYRWSLVSKPSTSNYDRLPTPYATSYNKFNFLADVVGEYVLALQVFDGINDSIVDHVHIEVTENQRPVAILPDDIALHNSGSQWIQSTKSYDPEGQPLKYAWQLINKPEDSVGEVLGLDYLSDAIILTDLPGTYTLQLTVNDGIQDSLPTTINFVLTPDEWHELTVSGQLVDDAGLPVVNAEVGGILQIKSTSDDTGHFEVLLRSKEKDSRLSTLFLTGENILLTALRLGETDNQQLDLGVVKLPVLQRKDVSLTACQGYTGTEKVTVNFFQQNTGYENMSFYQSVDTELIVGQNAVEIKLPATGVINMRLDTSIAGQVYTTSGESSFTHHYQHDDSQVDPLEITICN